MLKNMRSIDATPRPIAPLQMSSPQKSHWVLVFPFCTSIAFNSLHKLLASDLSTHPLTMSKESPSKIKKK